MPVLIVARLIGSLLSLGVLVAGLYLGWTWYEGDTTVLSDGRVVDVREEWRAWGAAALIAWSLLGRLIFAPLLGRADDERSKLPLRREGGEMIDSPTGARLYLERHGDPAKPALIFTHGWGLDSTIWRYAKRDLAQDFHVVVWDLPSLGRSTTGADRRLDPTRFAADLQAVVKHVRAEPAILVGHSIGGMAIESFVRDAPQAVNRSIGGIVLLNTTYTNPLETTFASGFFRSIRWPLLEPTLFFTRLLAPLAWLDAWRAYLSGWAHIANRIQFGHSVTRSQLEAVTHLGTRNPQGALARGNQGMFRWDASTAMSGFDGPILVIGGRADLVTKVEASRRIAGEKQGARLVEVDGVNHNGFLEDWETYRKAIVDLARQVQSVSQALAAPAPIAEIKVPKFAGSAPDAPASSLRS